MECLERLESLMCGGMHGVCMKRLVYCGVSGNSGVCGGIPGASGKSGVGAWWNFWNV